MEKTRIGRPRVCVELLCIQIVGMQKGIDACVSKPGLGRKQFPANRRNVENMVAVPEWLV